MSNDIQKQINNALKNLDMKNVNVQRALMGALTESALKVQREAQELMTNTTVNMAVSYYTHNKKIPHHPSMPNNPPAVDTGTLRRSITFEVNEIDNGAEAKVGSTIKNPPYPAYLEYGTSVMAPRPWLSPAMENSREFIIDAIKKAIQKEVSKK